MKIFFTRDLSRTTVQLRSLVLSQIFQCQCTLCAILCMKSIKVLSLQLLEHFSMKLFNNSVQIA